jgi:4-hydroxy-3-methylbut-2-enyl diphosphate reductase IspH
MMAPAPTPPTESPRRVLVAKPRGYCAGVDRAVLTVEKALEAYGAPVYVRKQIVHNAHVVRTLEAQGAIFVEEAEEVPEGATVVFSAHGVAPTVHVEAAARSLKTIDATCPLVTKVHLEARRFAADDLDIVLIGHEGHEEVVGTTGQAPERIHLVDDASEIDPAWLEGVSTVGLTSGASVPEELVVDVMRWLAARGYGEVQEVESAQESLLFALPPELRRDLRAAGISDKA